ncbi:hypothetical protein YK56LOC_21200 [Caballeronia sp. HLA56]
MLIVCLASAMLVRSRKLITYEITSSGMSLRNSSAFSDAWGDACVELREELGVDMMTPGVRTDWKSRARMDDEVKRRGEIGRLS